MTEHDNPDAVIVARAARALADKPLDASAAAAPELIWRRAHLLRRLNAERRAMAPLEVGVLASTGVASVAAIVITVAFWENLPSVAAAPAGMALLTLAVAAIAAGFSAWRLRTA